MKRYFLIIALLACALPSFGAIAFSNSGKATAGPGGSTAIPVTVTVNAGDTVVVCVDMHAGAARTVSGVVDSSGGNTYAQQITGNNATTVQTAIWASANVANSATSVTVTVSNTTSTEINVNVVTYTGVNALGTSVAATAATSTTPTVTLTTQDANNVVVACLSQTAASIVAFSANTGNLRSSQVDSTTLRVGGANDNTAATATAVVNTVTSTRSAAWGGSALELRSGATAVNHTLLLMGVGE